MITSNDDRWLVAVAWRLDRLRRVPSALLGALVRRDGACMTPQVDEPEWLDEPQTDRDLAARLCAGCVVPDECLEYELRTAGAGTVGVWGAMPETDRRTLHPHWLRRGERAGGRP